MVRSADSVVVKQAGNDVMMWGLAAGERPSDLGAAPVASGFKDGRRHKTDDADVVRLERLSRPAGAA